MKYNIGDYVIFKDLSNELRIGKIESYHAEIGMYFICDNGNLIYAVMPQNIICNWKHSKNAYNCFLDETWVQTKTNLFSNYNYYNLGFNPFDGGTIKIDVKRENLPNNVFFNDKKKATTLMFGKEATVVKCGKDDEYSRRIGFLEAYFQATCGLSKTKAKKYLENIVKDKEEKK